MAYKGDGAEVIDALAVGELDLSALAVANGTKTVSVTALGPTALTATTIQKWIKIIIGGEVFYMPLWK